MKLYLTLVRVFGISWPSQTTMWGTHYVLCAPHYLLFSFVRSNRVVLCLNIACKMRHPYLHVMG